MSTLSRLVVIAVSHVSEYAVAMTVPAAGQVLMVELS